MWGTPVLQERALQNKARLGFLIYGLTEPFFNDGGVDKLWITCAQLVDNLKKRVWYTYGMPYEFNLINFLIGFIFGFIGGLQYPHIREFLKKF